MRKVTVSLGDAVVQVLRDLADRRGQTVSEVLGHAISNEQFFQNEIDAGSKILIETIDKRLARVVFH